MKENIQNIKVCQIRRIWLVEKVLMVHATHVLWFGDDSKGTGKSFSEAHILASVNPQYEKRLFIEFPEK